MGTDAPSISTRPPTSPVVILMLTFHLAADNRRSHHHGAVAAPHGCPRLDPPRRLGSCSCLWPYRKSKAYSIVELHAGTRRPRRREACPCQHHHHHNVAPSGPPVECFPEHIPCRNLHPAVCHALALRHHGEPPAPTLILVDDNHPAGRPVRDAPHGHMSTAVLPVPLYGAPSSPPPAPPLWQRQYVADHPGQSRGGRKPESHQPDSPECLLSGSLESQHACHRH